MTEFNMSVHSMCFSRVLKTLWLSLILRTWTLNLQAQRPHARILWKSDTTSLVNLVKGMSHQQWDCFLVSLSHFSHSSLSLLTSNLQTMSLLQLVLFFHKVHSMHKPPFLENLDDLYHLLLSQSHFVSYACPHALSVSFFTSSASFLHVFLLLHLQRMWHLFPNDQTEQLQLHVNIVNKGQW